MPDGTADAWVMERPLDAIGASVPWVKNQLQEREVSLHPSCAFRKGMERTELLREQAMAGRAFKFGSPECGYDLFAEAYGVDVLTKALHLGALSGLQVPDERWVMLGSGDPIPTRASPRTRERDLTWETFVACLTSSFATNVQFAEPDITCTFEKRTFAVAAKAAYTESGVANAIRDGFSQADGKADASLVMVNAAGIYPARANFGIRDFADAVSATECMRSAVARWCDSFGFEGLHRKFRTRATEPIGVTFFVPMILTIERKPTPFLYTCLPISWDADAGPDFEFAKAFLQACNGVHGFSIEAAATTTSP